jgi:hypothetical protein
MGTTCSGACTRTLRRPLSWLRQRGPFIRGPHRGPHRFAQTAPIAQAASLNHAVLCVPLCREWAGQVSNLLSYRPTFEHLTGLMARNHTTIMAVICLVFGVKLLGDSISDFSS